MAGAAVQKRMAFAMCLVICMDSALNARRTYPHRAKRAWGSSRSHAKMLWFRRGVTTLQPDITLADRTTQRPKEEPVPQSTTPAPVTRANTSSTDDVTTVGSAVAEAESSKPFVTISSSAVGDSVQLEYGLDSDTTGYIQSPGFNGKTPLVVDEVDTKVTLQLHHHDVLMVSFSRAMNIPGGGFRCSVGSGLFLLNETSGLSTELDLHCGINMPPPVVYADISTFSVRYLSLYNFGHKFIGFQLRFSTHKRPQIPQVFPNGTWDCSSPYWPQFQQHLHCNLRLECSDGRDELRCPYSGRNCSSGQWQIGSRCYSIVIGNQDNRMATVVKLDSSCRAVGGQLASLNTPTEWTALEEFLAENVGIKHFTIGLRTASQTLPDMYRHNWQHSDGTIAYYIGREMLYHPLTACFTMVIHTKGVNFNCILQDNFNIVCEHNPLVPPAVPRIRLRPPPDLPSFTQAFNRSYLRCPLGHFTHISLACHVDSDCWSRDRLRGDCDLPLTPFPPDFSCANGVQGVPYALVCDFRLDCADGSDETFCTHPPCDVHSEFECSNKECVSITVVCNSFFDCKDGSDEEYCNPRDTYTYQFSTPPPAQVDFTGRALEVKHIPHYWDALALHFLCPNTHFQCANNGFCLPVFLFCNGVKDCPEGEDEVECDDFTCPGFYRCRGSRSCIVLEQLCDGLKQCPLHDDELHCSPHCPPSCTCYGEILFCNSTFETHNFLFVRYLDASGSGLSSDSLSNNTMLIHLSLARCQLRHLAFLSLPNLHVLDLSHNDIAVLSLQHLSKMPYLQWLSVAENPIQLLFSASESTESLLFPRLHFLNLAGVRVHEISMATIAVFPNLQNLNLSRSGVERVPEDGEHVLRKMRVLDLRGCPVTYFPRTIFQGWNDLESVLADNYKLCCPSTLPSRFNPVNCKAPLDEVSSCQALLRSDVYRVFLSVFSALALLGNLVCLVARLIWKPIQSNMGFDVFVANLCVSDFVMGVYLAIVGTADRVYLGTYLWDDLTWRHSAACKVAGFLSLLSCEVSAFIICLITLDRFLVVKFPLSQIRFHRRSALIVCGIVWAVGIALAAVPLMPGARHWHFYSQHGICIPLPVTRNDFAGRHYAFGVMIVLNFLLFFLIAMGQLVIYWAVQTNRLAPVDAAKKGSASRDLKLARRLMAVAMSDFLCWFPIGLLGLLTTTGTAVSGEVNVAIAIFVLPLNSAINPFLYTFNTLIERLQDAREERLRQFLLARLQADAKERLRRVANTARDIQTLTTTGQGVDIQRDAALEKLAEEEEKNNEKGDQDVAGTTQDQPTEIQQEEATETSTKQDPETSLEPTTDVPLKQGTEILEPGTETPSRLEATTHVQYK